MSCKEVQITSLHCLVEQVNAGINLKIVTENAGAGGVVARLPDSRRGHGIGRVYWIPIF